MSKTTKEVAAKPRKGYSKTRAEHYKDIVIAVLVAGIVAFVGGVMFANGNNAKVQAAIDAVQPTANAQASK